MSEERLFTVEEADRALPELRERLPRIRAARQAVLAAAERIGERAPGDGGGREGRRHHEALAALRADLLALQRLGVILRDPESGLVDFPAEREGRRVFLCWRLGEERVSHWHEVDAGFAGRRPL